MSNRPVKCVVAIDGPAASGKSTVSRRVAADLGFIYVDSGALYRGVTWKAVRDGVDVRHREAVVRMLGESRWEFGVLDNAVAFSIDDEDPGPQLRSEPVRERVSDIAAVPEVRAFIVARLREMARFGHLVVEGRDIGSVVFPDTDLKFYLDADPEERAKRRHRELAATEGASDVSAVRNSLRRRDRKDSTRVTAPLQIPLGARVIDTTALTIDQVVAEIVRDIRSRMPPP